MLKKKLQQASLTQSTSEAGQFVQSGAVSIDTRKISEENRRK